MLISLYDTQADMQIITVITFETADPARGRCTVAALARRLGDAKASRSRRPAAERTVVAT